MSAEPKEWPMWVILEKGLVLVVGERVPWRRWVVSAWRASVSSANWISFRASPCWDAPKPRRSQVRVE